MIGAKGTGKQRWGLDVWWFRDTCLNGSRGNSGGTLPIRLVATVAVVTESGTSCVKKLPVHGAGIFVEEGR